MKHIRANSDNTIQMISDRVYPNTEPYAGELPEDFYQTFSKGKYLFVDGEIVENPNYSEQGESDEIEEDTPHRTVLIEAGVTTKAELSNIDDLTTLKGIGEAKAEDINEYLSTKNNEA